MIRSTQPARWLLVPIVMLSFFACSTGWQDTLNQVAAGMQTRKGLTQQDIAAGLKEALVVGASNAVDLTGRLNGYYQNPEIRIPLPEKVRDVENLLRVAGLESQVQAFEKSMNRAAEKAAPEAQALFMQAIKQMTISDAKRILNGRDNEATLYFKSKTYQPLANRFEPIVHSAMAEVGVTRYYQSLSSRVRNIPLVGDSFNFDLDQYVTDQALDGLFLVLAEEKARIRTDPAARVTELLRMVFGKQ